MKVLIINQYAGNKGDRAVAYLEIRELLKNNNIEKIYLSSNNPDWWSSDDFMKNLRLEIIPWGWNVQGFNPRNRIDWEKRRIRRVFVLPFLAWCYNKNIKLPYCLSKIFVNNKYLKAVESSDVIISTGGHHLTTRFSENLRGELMFDMIVASMYKKLILWSQTYGPFNFTNSNLKNACIKLLKTSEVYVRDIESTEELRKLGINNFSRTFETVIGLEDVIKDYILPSKREKTVGITIYNAESRTKQVYDNYVNIIAQSADYLTERGYKVLFFPHEIKTSVVNDRICIKDIMVKCVHKDNIDYLKDDIGTKEHLEEISKLSMFIGHKTHSIVFALTVGTPLLPIAYHPKTVDFLKQYDLSDNIVNENELSFSLMKKKIDYILNNLDKIGLQEKEKSSEFGKYVRGDFAKLLKK